MFFSMVSSTLPLAFVTGQDSLAFECPLHNDLHTGWKLVGSRK